MAALGDLHRLLLEFSVRDVGSTLAACATDETTITGHSAGQPQVNSWSDSIASMTESISKQTIL
jgi:hypothetical protein